MSFDLYVLSAEVEADDPEELIELPEDEQQWGGELVPELQEVADALESTWPTLEEDADSSPWATHPLEQPLHGGKILALNIGWSYVEPTVPGIQRICAQRSLRTYDPQSDIIAVPEGTRSRPGLLQRLFGKD